MSDLSHVWAGDLAVGSTGDLALADGAQMTSQRIYRRLLTNPQAYIWNLTYGGGLARFVGAPARPSEIAAVVRSQLAQEATVASLPPPAVNATITDTANGYFEVDILYTDASSGNATQLTVGPVLPA